MKAIVKIGFIVVVFLVLTGCGNKRQITANETEGIERIGQSEIDKGEQPRAVAYKFVMSIVDENYVDAVELMSLELFFNLMPMLVLEEVPIDQLFSTKYGHKIVDMRPVVKMGYEVVVTNVQDVDSQNFFDDGSNYRDAPAFRVSLNCADANGKIYDGSQGSYDTEVHVVIVREDDEWKVYNYE